MCLILDQQSTHPKVFNFSKKLKYLYPNCGKTIFVGAGLIYGGNQSKKNQWPWFASLYDRKNQNNFFCGASVITKRHLLSGELDKIKKILRTVN